MSTDINETLGISGPSSSPQNPVQPDKYSSLKSIAGAISVFAWIAGAVIFIFGIFAGVKIRGESAGMSALIMLLYSFMAAFIVITLLAQAGVIKVLIDIEKNTRKTEKQQMS